jgi:hypothetical protein
VQGSQIRVLEGLVYCDSLFRVEGQHFLQQVYGYRRTGFKFFVKALLRIFP